MNNKNYIMGVKLTEIDITNEIKKNPNTAQFDECCKCHGIEFYMDMHDFGNPDTFEVICTECLHSK